MDAERFEALALYILGPVQIKVTADVDLGEGMELITGILDLEIAGNKAVSLGIIAGTPREQAV